VQKIRIKNASDTTYPHGGRHVIVDAVLGKHNVVVWIKPNGVQILVVNASHKAWRGMGKHYPTAAAAIAAYKTPAVRQIIETITSAYSAKAAA